MRFIIVLFIFVCLNPLLISEETDLYQLINDYRVNNGLQRLIYEDTLRITAEKYTQILISDKRISHIDREGGRVLNRYKAMGGTATNAGEILGTSTELLQIFEAWKNSDSHRKVILNPKWKRIGLNSGVTGESVVSVVLFSNSLIDNIHYEVFQNKQRMNFDWILENSEPDFPDHINAEITVDKQNQFDTYSLLFEVENLPILIPVYNRIEGRKEISDFIYIPDILLDETH